MVIYKNCDKQALDAIKDAITLLFRDYFIETVNVTFMNNDEFQRRYRLADKFVLQLMHAQKKTP